VVFKLLQVILLLGNLFSELKQLLLLAHTDGVVLVCLFAFAECVSVFSIDISLCSTNSQYPSESPPQFEASIQVLGN
jgi:hypothetical protein